MPGFGPIGARPVASIGGGDGNYYPSPGGIVFRGSNVTPNQIFPNAGRVAVHGVLPTAVNAAPRVTWIGLEILHAGSAQARVTWDGLEILRTVTSIPTEWVVSWMGLEVAHVGSASARVTWMGAEALHIGQAAARLTWMGIEVLRSLTDVPPDAGFVYLIC